MAHQRGKSEARLIPNLAKKVGSKSRVGSIQEEVKGPAMYDQQEGAPTAKFSTTFG